jgi:hypothetical protein
LALPFAVAAPVGAVPGTTQLAWHVAAWELQSIMQLVTVDDCASRILSAAALLTDPPLAKLTAKTANTSTTRSMTASRFSIARRHHNATAVTGKCRTGKSRSRFSPRLAEA